MKQTILLFVLILVVAVICINYLFCFVLFLQDKIVNIVVATVLAVFVTVIALV